MLLGMVGLSGLLVACYYFFFCKTIVPEPRAHDAKLGWSARIQIGPLQLPPCCCWMEVVAPQGQ